ncbi:MAG TPA: TetR family transcriptional regulator C-terminal domain-containing protein [Aquabacterium sp.]|uniref:TetR/AcrR family transcriptional regulator n=1 Tax=Aquabacterium sp. TaxID=1872578 RepID=UPI002E351AA6|nr:TetR family transcriptional regulator C-terminal domain-containing protein [Aquabacterium sp.]HEX5371929.1 TetR family transcriptional regulator C-terminal domain-containing protein [Aquabacterium sp.]
MARTADKTDIPRRLTDAGYALFTQNGYNATGIQQITDQAGVPKGSFYNHFDSKEAFAGQIIRHYAEWVDQSWQSCLQDAPADPLDTIRHLFGKFIRHHEQAVCPGCLVGNFAAEVSESSESCRAALSAVMDTWRERLAVLIRQAQQAGRVRQDLDALTLAGFFWDAWEGALLRMKVEHDSRPLKEALSLMLDKFFQP